MNSKGLVFGQFLLAIIITSTSGPFGRYIDLPVPVIIFSRCFLAGVALLLVQKASGQSIKIRTRSDFYNIALTAVLLGLHWMTYFAALKYSNVAVGMLSMFAFPVVTAIIEPLFFKGAFDYKSIGLALLGFTGIFFLVPELSFDNTITVGVAFGLFSSVLYAFRNLISKPIVADYSGVTVMMYQALIISVMLAPSLFWVSFDEWGALDQPNWLSILALGLFTTAVGHTWMVKSFAYFPVTMLSVINCLAPVAGIVLGYLFLGEEPTSQVITGGAIILLSVVLESLRMLRVSKT